VKTAGVAQVLTSQMAPGDTTVGSRPKGHEDAGLFRKVKERNVIYNARDIKASAHQQPPSATFTLRLIPLSQVDQYLGLAGRI